MNIFIVLYCICCNMFLVLLAWDCNTTVFLLPKVVFNKAIIKQYGSTPQGLNTFPFTLHLFAGGSPWNNPQSVTC